MRLAVLGVVSDGLRELQVEARESSFKCPLGDVVRVHDADYVHSLQDKCSKLPATSDVTPCQAATPAVTGVRKWKCTARCNLQASPKRAETRRRRLFQSR